MYQASSKVGGGLGEGGAGKTLTDIETFNMAEILTFVWSDATTCLGFFGHFSEHVLPQNLSPYNLHYTSKKNFQICQFFINFWFSDLLFIIKSNQH